MKSIDRRKRNIQRKFQKPNSRYLNAQFVAYHCATQYAKIISTVDKSIAEKEKKSSRLAYWFL